MCVMNQSACMSMPPKPFNSKLIRRKDTSYRLSHNQSITYIPDYDFPKGSRGYPFLRKTS